MADYLIGSYESGDYKVEIHQITDGTPDQDSIIVKDEVIKIGNDSEPFAWHLRGELQLQIIDKSNRFRDLFSNPTPGEFYVKSFINNEVVFYGVPIANFIGGQFWKTYNVRTFVFSDGLSLLKDQPNTYKEYIQLGDFFDSIISDIGADQSMRLIFDYEHDGASGYDGIIPQRIRINPADFVSDLEFPTKYDVLKAVIEFFKLQIWVENNVWWIAQRNIRNNPPSYYELNTGVWESTSMPVALNISRNDFRSSETEDMQFDGASKMTRTVKQAGQEFQTTDPFFYPKYHNDGDPLYWPGTGNVSSASSPTRLLFDDPDPVRSQVIRRVVKQDDIINLKFRSNLEFESGLPDGNYYYKVATIKALHLDGAQDYWLDENGQWESTEQLVDAWVGVSGNLAIISGQYDTEKSFDIDIDSDPVPSATASDDYYVIEMTMHLVGDDVFVFANPIEYLEFNISAVEISDIFNEVVYEALLSPSISRTVLKDEVKTTDQELRAYQESIQWWDGTDWQRGIDWTTALNEPIRLQEQILLNHLSMLSKMPKGYRIQLPWRHDVSLSDLVSLSDFEPGIDFIPFVIEHRRKEKRSVLSVADLTEARDLITTTYQVK